MSGEQERVVIDLSIADTITLAEWADIEDAARRSMIGVNLRRPPMWVVAGLLWIERRRDDPKAQYADFAALTVGAIQWGREENPTTAAGEENPAA